MNWFALSLLSALFSAAAAITQKKVLQKEETLEFSTLLSIIIFLIGLPIYFSIDYHSLTSATIIALLIKSFLYTFSFFATMNGLKELDIGASLPFLALTPAFVAIFAFTFLGEHLSFFQIAGLALLSIGSYLLQHKGKIHFNPKGHWSIIAAIVLMTSTALLDKFILNRYKTSPYTFLAFQHLFTAIFFVISFFIMRQGKFPIKNTFKNSVRWILLIALFTIIYRYTQLRAIQNAPVAMVIALKRLSIFIAVVIGGSLFKEKKLLVKICATFLMVAGAALIAYYSPIKD